MTPSAPKNPWLSRNSLASAEVVVPLVLRYVAAETVVDFGCKHGEWLSILQRSGVREILGFDQGKRRDRLTIRPEEFRVADLSQPLDLKSTFDLAVCIEVAEHLPKASAGPLVKTLTSVAPVVLFSAATPGQGGHGHTNEQPRTFWHAEFAKHGFRPIDCLRPLIWQDARVAFWYRQNLFFYASAEGLARHSALAAEARREVASDLELVHVDVLHRRSAFRRMGRTVARLVLRR